MYETKRQAPLTQVRFAWRLARQVAWVLVLLAVSLMLGMLGYVSCEGLSWIDAF